MFVDCTGIGGRPWLGECIWTGTDKDNKMTWGACWEYCKSETNRRMIIVRDNNKQEAVEEYLTSRNNNGIAFEFQISSLP